MNRIKKNFFLLINFVILSIIYFFGIGLTSLFAKIFSKKFLVIENNKIKTSFKDFRLEDSLEKMF